MTIPSEIERFSKDVATKESLRNELKPQGTSNEAIVKFANSKGYNFTIADVNKLKGDGELSDMQLEAVGGGLKGVLLAGSDTGYVYAKAGTVFIWGL